MPPPPTATPDPPTPHSAVAYMQATRGSKLDEHATPAWLDFLVWCGMVWCGVVCMVHGTAIPHRTPRGPRHLHTYQHTLPHKPTHTRHPPAHQHAPTRYYPYVATGHATTPTHHTQSKEITDTIPDELAMAQALDGQAKARQTALDEDNARERRGLARTAHAVKMYLDSGFTTFEAVVTFHILLVAVTVGYVNSSSVITLPRRMYTI